MTHSDEWRAGVEAARAVVVRFQRVRSFNESDMLRNAVVRCQLIRIDELLVENKPDGKTDTGL